MERIQLERDSVVVTFDVPAHRLSAIKHLAHKFIDNPAATFFSAIELHAAFIQYCVDNGSSETVLAVFEAFGLIYDTAATDIHVVVQAQGLENAAARRVLKGYFSAWSFCPWPAAPQSALFSAENTGLMAMFGGQLGAGSYLDEAMWLFDVYRPLLVDFVTCMSAFLHRESQDKRVVR
ncbi:hypothetical protein GGI21_000068, partial [Coemansia aciculifera]